MRIVEAGSRTLPGLNAAIGNWVSMQLWGAPGKIEKFSSFGVFRNDALVAGVLYHNWHPEAGVIEITAASVDPKWFNRTVLRTLFGIPFDRWGCQLVVWRVAPANLTLIKMGMRFGFSCYRIPRLRGRNEDEVVMTLTDDRWRMQRRLLEKKHGQVVASVAA